jgi:hypothetical protein
MKKIILSAVVASMALTTAASAIENVKANGQAKLIYQGSEDNTGGTAGDNGLFDQTGAAGQASVIMGISADLSTNLKGAIEVTGVSTLGLENNLVGGTMATNQDVNASGVGRATDDQFWISQAYLSYNMGNTTAKVGLQELNTPLAFTEKWNVVNNTFQAIVLVNNDIKDVTLVGAYVGKSNASSTTGGIPGGGGQTVNYDGKFNSFHGGAYAVGAVTKISGINAQAWYYDVDDVLSARLAADAYWLEADTKVGGVFIGGQYAGTKTDGNGQTQSIKAYALKVGTDIAGVHVFGAMSSVSDDNSAGTSLGFANTATGDKTKLYTGTASILADGAQVANEDTKAWKIGASTKVAGIALAANYTDIDYGQNATATNAGDDAKAWDLSAGTTLGGVALKGIYTNYQQDNTNGTKQTDKDLFRLIATAKF